MNSKQKAYDSYDKTTKMLKQTESQYHNRNLYLIKNRKNAQLNTNHSYQFTIKHPDDPINRFFKEKNDKYIQWKLMKIGQKQAKPALNEDFIFNEQKKKVYSINKMKDEKKVIQRQNEEMFSRMAQLRSFISAKDMDDTFNKEHNRMLQKLKKVENGKLLLPQLTQRNSNGFRTLTDATPDEKKATKDTSPDS